MQRNLAVLVVILSVLKVNSFDEKFGELFSHSFHHFTDIFSIRLQSFQQTIESPIHLNEYDFIIVGSGAGGCVLANRLSENLDWNVLLIEAGKVETFIQNVPLFAKGSQMTQFDWSYKSEPQTDACWGMTNEMCALSRGKGLGGSSIINYMIYSRGHQNDFDRWAAAGNDGWAYKDVLPYFLKSERSTLRNLRNSSNHNRDGELNVEYNQYRTKIADAFVEANKFLGQSEIDYNSGQNLGVSYIQSNTLNGNRHSAYRAFIAPILDRPNLHVMLGQVTNIIIDPKNKVACGVQFYKNRQRISVYAKKEVIIASGAFHSPQLLMLSGIGPKEELQRHNIKMVQELPVGKTMSDHLCYFGLTIVFNTTGNSFNFNNLLHPGLFLDFLSGQGPLTTSTGGEALSFIKTYSANNRDADVPDIEILSAAAGFHSDYSLSLKSLNVKQQIYETVYKPLIDNNVDTFTALIVLLHPKSTGDIKLRNVHPYTAPKINPKFLEHPDDIETVLEGIKYVLRYIDTPQFQRLGARLNPNPLPSCMHMEFGTDDYWRCSIRTMSTTFHDQTGTCKMGPADDPTAVVSPELKVHGVDNLRVVDTSIIPESPTGHTAALSYMIGEKAADLIKQYWSENIFENAQGGMETPREVTKPANVGIPETSGAEDINALIEPVMKYKEKYSSPNPTESTTARITTELRERTTQATTTYETTISSKPLHYSTTTPATEATTTPYVPFTTEGTTTQRVIQVDLQNIVNSGDFLKYPEEKPGNNEMKIPDEGTDGEVLLEEDDIRRKRMQHRFYW